MRYLMPIANVAVKSCEFMAYITARITFATDNDDKVFGEFKPSLEKTKVAKLMLYAETT